MELVKAIIEVLDEQAIEPNGPLPASLEVLFNPTEYTLNKGAQIAEIGIYGIDSPILQFIRGQNEKLNMDLFFDTTREGGTGVGAVSVTTYTKSFYQLVKIQSKTHAPPRIRFTWGTDLSFKAIVESVQQKFSLFSPLGVPLRATLSVAFREYRNLEEQLAELKFESADVSKQFVVSAGDTLSRIAAREYGDPALWREIAAANPSLPSLRRLPPGFILSIPPLDPSRRPLLTLQ
jgi:Contractile injection system tube protein/LysM domain